MANEGLTLYNSTTAGPLLGFSFNPKEDNLGLQAFSINQHCLDQKS